MASIATETTCRVFGQLAELLAPDSLNRFVVGEDSEPSRLDSDGIGRLGDPFATLLLSKGSFPHTAVGVLEALDQALAEGDPLAPSTQMSFVLGEGSQIPFSDSDSLDRGLRFLVARGSGPEGPDLIISAFGPDQGDGIELMAWDRGAGGFNFYRSVGEQGAWVLAGNSRHGVTEQSEGKGPFESHPSGNFLMKELRAPWVNWHSPDANIFPTAFSDDDPRREHPWFTQKVEQGALVCETAVARPAIKRWAKARFEQVVGASSAVERPRRIVQQIVDTPTVNLMSSHTEGRVASAAPSVDLPPTFFVDSEALTEILQLRAPPAFAVSGQLYGHCLELFEVRLDDGSGFTREGDTHFVFVIPERASEDQEVLRRALEVGLVSERLAACLLMTDFPNPVFSDRRASLLAHAPDTGVVSDGGAVFSQQMADAILAAADQSPPESAEREFAERWGAGDGWRDAFNELLAGYYTALTNGLQSQDTFEQYFQLAESRRDHVREMPIFESRLLFAHTNIPSSKRQMRPDGSVTTGADG